MGVRNSRQILVEHEQRVVVEVICLHRCPVRSDLDLALRSKREALAITFLHGRKANPLYVPTISSHPMRRSRPARTGIAEVSKAGQYFREEIEHAKGDRSDCGSAGHDNCCTIFPPGLAGLREESDRRLA